MIGPGSDKNENGTFSRLSLTLLFSFAIECYTYVKRILHLIPIKNPNNEDQYDHHQTPHRGAGSRTESSEGKSGLARRNLYNDILYDDILYKLITYIMIMIVINIARIEVKILTKPSFR